MFTKIPCDELWTGVATYEKGIFYGAVLVRGRHFFYAKGENMEEKDVLAFKLACKNYFFTLDLQSLRAYGRLLNMPKPTVLKKGDLIEEIIKILCGESRPRSTKKGAPIKCDYLDKINQASSPILSTAPVEIPTTAKVALP